MMNAITLSVSRLSVVELSAERHFVQSHRFETKRANFKLKTRPKQLLGTLPVDFVLNQSILSLFLPGPMIESPLHIPNSSTPRPGNPY
jgi:hypothetical protein